MARRLLLGTALVGAGLRLSLVVPLTTSCGAFTATIDAGIDGMSVASCSDIDAQDCNSNDDCPKADHCTVAGLDAGLAVTCCVPGVRGTLEAGAPCTSLDECPTGVCTYTAPGTTGPTMEVCSPDCTSDTFCQKATQGLLPVCVSYPNPDSGTRFCGLGQ